MWGALRPDRPAAEPVRGLRNDGPNGGRRVGFGRRRGRDGPSLAVRPEPPLRPRRNIKKLAALGAEPLTRLCCRSGLVKDTGPLAPLASRAFASATPSAPPQRRRQKDSLRSSFRAFDSAYAVASASSKTPNPRYAPFRAFASATPPAPPQRRRQKDSLRSSFRAFDSAYAVASASSKTPSNSPSSSRRLNVRASSPSMVTPSETQVPATSFAALRTS